MIVHGKISTLGSLLPMTKTLIIKRHSIRKKSLLTTTHLQYTVAFNYQAGYTLLCTVVPTKTLSTILWRFLSGFCMVPCLEKLKKLDFFFLSMKNLVTARPEFRHISETRTEVMKIYCTEI